MWEVLFSNLALIGALLVMFLCALSANTLFGVYYNVATLKESFKLDKLLLGLLRGAVVLVGVVGLIVVISLAPFILESAGLSDLTEAIINAISVIAIVGVILTATITYLIQALEKFKKILIPKPPVEEPSNTTNK